MQSSQRRCDPIKAVLSVPSSSVSSQAGQFGPNEWLVEEMYQRFLDDPSAVDPAWHDFFADYRPDGMDDADVAPAKGTAGGTARASKDSAKDTGTSTAKSTPKDTAKDTATPRSAAPQVGT